MNHEQIAALQQLIDDKAEAQAERMAYHLVGRARDFLSNNRAGPQMAPVRDAFQRFYGLLLEELKNRTRREVLEYLVDEASQGIALTGELFSEEHPEEPEQPKGGRVNAKA